MTMTVITAAPAQRQILCLRLKVPAIFKGFPGRTFVSGSILTTARHGSNENLGGIGTIGCIWKMPAGGHFSENICFAGLGPLE
jgi:hypothetical protein